MRLQYRAVLDDPSQLLSLSPITLARGACSELGSPSWRSQNSMRCSSVLFQKYLDHNAMDGYMGVHGYDNQEVAAATG
jgi:hypothetical protein